MQQLYVCSRPLLNDKGEMKRHLIGILMYVDSKYQFEYRLNKSLECMKLILPIFPDIDRKYENDEVRILLEDYLPSENSTAFINDILKKTNQSHYDEWMWLRTFNSDDINMETCLYETLNEDIIRHDNNIDIDEIDDVDEIDGLDDLDNFETEKENSIFNDNNDIDDNTDSESEDDVDDEDGLDALTDDSDILLQEITKTDDIMKNAKLIQPIVQKIPDKKLGIITTITVKSHSNRKPNIATSKDFITPPPKSPMDDIKNKLIKNQEIRQKKLNEELKNS